MTESERLEKLEKLFDQMRAKCLVRVRRHKAVHSLEAENYWKGFAHALDWSRIQILIERGNLKDKSAGAVSE